MAAIFRCIFSLKTVTISVLVGLAVVLLPIAALRAPEIITYAQYHPLRAISEAVCILLIVFSLASNGLGLTVKAQNHSLVGMLLFGNSPRIVALRLLWLVLVLSSFSRGLNPDHAQLRDLSQQTALVTGATGGLGFETAKTLAEQGANLILLVRNKQRAEECVANIKISAPNSRIDVVVADQEDLRAVASAAKEIKTLSPRGLDILVLNAGLAPGPPLRLGPSGYESTITSMHLSHQYLTMLLWQHLNPDARIVVTSSVVQVIAEGVDSIFAAITNLQDDHPVLQSYGHVYGRAKLANALFARHLGVLADSDPRRIKVSSHHPGMVATSIWQKGFRVEGLADTLMTALLQTLLRSPAQGAATLIDAAAGSAPLPGQDQAPNGSYYTSSLLVTIPFLVNPLLKNESAALEAWERTEVYLAPFVSLTQ